MSNENLPVKKEKKANIFKRGLSAFLAFVGVSGVGYHQAKTMDDYKEDYNSNNGYTEKATENVEAKYDKTFDQMGIEVVDIQEAYSKENLVDIEDKNIEDKLVEIEDKVIDKNSSMLEELRENVNNDDLLQYIEDKDAEGNLTEIEDKLVEIEDKGI